MHKNIRTFSDKNIVTSYLPCVHREFAKFAAFLSLPGQSRQWKCPGTLLVLVLSPKTVQCLNAQVARSTGCDFVTTHRLFAKGSCFCFFCGLPTISRRFLLAIVLLRIPPATAFLCCREGECITECSLVIHAGDRNVLRTTQVNISVE